MKRFLRLASLFVVIPTACGTKTDGSDDTQLPAAATSPQGMSSSSTISMQSIGISSMSLGATVPTLPSGAMSSPNSTVSAGMPNGSAPPPGMTTLAASMSASPPGSVSPAASMSAEVGVEPAPTGSLTISNLEIRPNPNMTISCYVSWTTSEPASSEVQFGVGDYKYRISHEEAVTEHEVLVIGMHAEDLYKIKALSSNAENSGSAEGEFTTGKLPSGYPKATVTHSAGYQPGWTLTNIQVGGGTGGFSVSSSFPALIVMVDEEGEIVWYYTHGTTTDSRGDVSSMPLPNGNVLIGAGTSEPPREVDLSGAVVWQGPSQPGGMGAGGMGGGSTSTERMSHHTGKLNSGNYIILREVSGGGNRIEEITPELEVVWSWNLFDYVTKPSGEASDWCHGNSVTVDEVKGFVYLNCRYIGLFKIDRASKELIWHMGAALDGMDIGDFTYDPPDSMFNDSHDPEIHEDGTIIFYDNQGYMGRGGSGNHKTRVIEYQVDETNLTATPTWEFPGTFNVSDAWYKDDWYTSFWGDADRLANGDVLVTAGNRGSGTQTRIFEASPTGEVVWELRWPEDHGSFRAERLTPPLVEAL